MVMSNSYQNFMFMGDFQINREKIFHTLNRARLKILRTRIMLLSKFLTTAIRFRCLLSLIQNGAWKNSFLPIQDTCAFIGMVL